MSAAAKPSEVAVYSCCGSVQPLKEAVLGSHAETGIAGVDGLPTQYTSSCTLSTTPSWTPPTDISGRRVWQNSQNWQERLDLMRATPGLFLEDHVKAEVHGALLRHLWNLAPTPPTTPWDEAHPVSATGGSTGIDRTSY